MLLAALLRFHLLGAQSLWNDEGSSYVQATRSFADIAANAARDIHPPGYYWLLAIWRGLAGDSEFALRSLSTFASILSIAFTYVLGRRLFNPAAGLVAALFVALNTFSIYYAQEARMYALLALWGAAGMWGVVQAISHQLSPFTFQKMLSASLPLGLINAAGLYTQYAYPFLMLAQGAIVVISQLSAVSRQASAKRRHLWVLGVFVVANVLAVALYLPWLPTALKQVTSWPSTGQPIPTGEALGTILVWLAFGITSTNTPVSPFYPLILAVVIVTAFAGLFILTKGSRWRLSVHLLWVGIPLLLFLALGLFRLPNLKFLLPTQIGFALGIGAGVGAWWTLTPAGNPRWSTVSARIVSIIQLALMTALIALGIAPLYSDPAYQRSDYRAMAAVISAHPRPGDAIILDAPNQQEVFRYYYKSDAAIYTLPPGLGGNDTETLAAVQDIIAHHSNIYVLFWGEVERDPNHIVETTLDNTTYEAGQDVWYGDVRLAHYITPVQMPNITHSGAQFGDAITLDSYALSATTITAGDVLQIELNWRSDAVLNTHFKVFVQLLNTDGVLVAQRDSEPGGGSAPTTIWQPRVMVTDRHGLTIPADLPPGDYSLIIGLYNADDASARLPVGDKDYLPISAIRVQR